MSVIRVEGLRKHYFLGGEDLPVLKGLDFSIEPGEYVAITGTSGSGKSTLMNILGCLDSPTAGRFLLDGKDVAKVDDEELSRVRNEKIGFVFQTFNLLMRKNLIDNVMLPTLYHRETIGNERAEELLNKVGLGHRLHHKPSEISGGQRQRVAIARALANRPSLLLADEPTGNLDSRTTDEIMELFDTLNKEGATIVIVTHEDEIASHCRRRIHLVDGRLSEPPLPSPHPAMVELLPPDTKFPPA